jgi:membrane protein implicated in regulation of membrane protease activity
MDDGRDYRFGLGAVLFGVGFAGMITVGVALTKLWPNPWFVVSLGATIAGFVLIALAWFGMHRKSAEEPQPLGGSVGLKGNLGFVVQRVDPSVPAEEGNAQWNAECRPVKDSMARTFGQGVVLSIRSAENERRHLRCVVQTPDGSRHLSAKRKLFGSRARTSERFQFPEEFRPKPKRPLAVGYYPYIWIGDTGTVIGETKAELVTKVLPC